MAVSRTGSLAYSPGEVNGQERDLPIASTQYDEAVAAVSPDSRWIAYASDETGRHEIYVQAFPGPGPKHQVTDGRGIRLAVSLRGSTPDRPLRWSRDGRELFHWDGDTLMSVPVTIGATFASRISVDIYYDWSSNMTMKRIAAAKFKESCLALLDEVDADGIVITKHGKPVAKLIPYGAESAPLIGSLAKKIRVKGDIFSTEVAWDAES